MKIIILIIFLFILGFSFTKGVNLCKEFTQKNSQTFSKNVKTIRSSLGKQVR